MSKSVDKIEVPYMNRIPTFDFHDAGVVHDRVLLVEGMKFYVQSGLLSAWSDFFRTLFNAEFKEKNETEIKLEEVSAEGFKVFLQVIYPKSFEIQESHLESLIALSHRFLAPHVLEVCTQFIHREFFRIDKILLYKVAAMHDMECIKRIALVFITKNVESLNLIELLKLAFEYNLTSLKADLRSVIYTAKRVEKYRGCRQCRLRVQRTDCVHKGQSVSPLSHNSLIDEHIAEIIKLPVEIQSFVLVSCVRVT